MILGAKKCVHCGGAGKTVNGALMHINCLYCRGSGCTYEAGESSMDKMLGLKTASQIAKEKRDRLKKAESIKESEKKAKSTLKEMESESLEDVQKRIANMSAEDLKALSSASKNKKRGRPKKTDK